MVAVNEGSVATSEDVLVTNRLDEDRVMGEVESPGIQGHQAACSNLHKTAKSFDKKLLLQNDNLRNNPELAV